MKPLKLSCYGVHACCLNAFKPNASNLKPSRKPFQGNSRSHPPQPSVLRAFKPCRLRARKRFKPFHTLPHAFPCNSRSHAPQPSVFKGVQACRLPASNASNPSNPSVGFSKATLAATRPSHLFLRAFKRLPLPAFKPLKPLKPLQMLLRTKPCCKPLLFQCCSLPFACS